MRGGDFFALPWSNSDWLLSNVVLLNTTAATQKRILQSSFRQWFRCHVVAKNDSMPTILLSHDLSAQLG